MFQTTSQVSIQAAAKRGELTIATGIFYLAMSLGGSIGQASAGAVWTKILPEALARNLPASDVSRAQQICEYLDRSLMADKIVGSIVVAKGFDPSSPVGIAIRNSYVEAMKSGS